ncbi:MAG: hypothetical protein AB7G17_08780 [Phycisphaerales bacterium]
MTGKTMIAGVMAGVFGGVASAGMIVGAPVDTWSPSRYGVEFVSSSAGATGSLYFLGWQAVGETITYTTSTDSKGLGQFLFSNKGTSAGTTVEIGAFDAGTTLHFAYTITKGSGSAALNQIQRTDQTTSMFFATDWGTDSKGYFAKVGVEDILDVKKSDMDYNDVQFRVRAIPAPGGAALMAVSMLIAGPRGRRRM